MISRQNRIYLLALGLSVVLHLALLRWELDIFGERGAKVFIPVTLTPAVEREKEPAVAREMLVPALPADMSEGAVTRRGSLSALENRYVEFVVAEIEKRKFSPPESRYYGLIGNVVLGFVIGPRGRFQDMRLVRSSGDKLLDATALRALAAVDGRVKRPPWAGSRELPVQIVLKYQYRL